MQRRYIREPYEWFGVGCNDIEIEERDDLRGTVSAAQALDGIHARIGKHGHKITRAQFGVARSPVGARQGALGQLDAISL